MVKKDNTKIKNYVVEYSKRTIELEKEKEQNIIKSSRTLMIIDSILVIPIVIAFIELLKLNSAKLFVLIFGLTLVGLLLTSIIISIINIQTIKSHFTRSSKSLLEYLSNKKIDEEEYFIDQTIHDLDAIYLRIRRNNEIRNRLLFTTFIINCTFYLTIVGSVITIMLFI